MASTRTQVTKDSMFGRLERAGFDLTEISQADYPYVQEALGWKESTFKAALKYLGKEHDQLFEGFNNYFPTEAEVEVLVHEFGAFITVLQLLGCRWSAMWTLTLDRGLLTVDSQKKGERVQIPFERLSPKNQAAVYSWVNFGASVPGLEFHKVWPTGRYSGMTPEAARQRWIGLQKRGVISKQCKPHCFRHKMITDMINAGAPAKVVQRAAGHRSASTTDRYFHLSPDLQADWRERIQ